MKCPWPTLRAARAMRTAVAVDVHADDPIAASELAALALQQGWRFSLIAPQRFLLEKL
jgi:tRNA 2-thiouridine synthesizing protein A